MARRATVGLARVGDLGHTSSGDIFLAFSTGNHLPAEPGSLREIVMLPERSIDPIVAAAADATEEAILNALCAAETMTGREGRVVHVIPLDAPADALRPPQ